MDRERERAGPALRGCKVCDRTGPRFFGAPKFQKRLYIYIKKREHDHNAFLAELSTGGTVMYLCTGSTPHVYMVINFELCLVFFPIGHCPGNHFGPYFFKLDYLFFFYFNICSLISFIVCSKKKKKTFLSLYNLTFANTYAISNIIIK